MQNKYLLIFENKAVYFKKITRRYYNQISRTEKQEHKNTFKDFYNYHT